MSLLGSDKAYLCYLEAQHRYYMLVPASVCGIVPGDPSVLHAIPTELSSEIAEC
jgi:hypothetical protein